MQTFRSSALAYKVNGVRRKIDDYASPFKPTDINLILQVFFQRQNANGLYKNNLLHKSINIANTEELLGILKEGINNWPINKPMTHQNIDFIKKVLICIENKLKNESEDLNQEFNNILNKCFEKVGDIYILRKLDYKDPSFTHRVLHIYEARFYVRYAHLPR